MGSPNFAVYAACKAAQRSLVQRWRWSWRAEASG
jgi:hypothetical protein